MASSVSSESSFLKDALVSYAPYSNLQKQDIHKAALRWLQVHINNDLADKTILDQFAQKWRKDSNQPLSTDPIDFELLPGSYKGEKSVSNHQEEALTFLQEAVPVSIQENFKQRWDIKTKLQVSNSAGAIFKVDQRDMALLKQTDANGDGTAWYQVKNRSVYYVLSYEEKGDDYFVELGEEISPQNKNAWFVAKEQIKISST